MTLRTAKSDHRSARDGSSLIEERGDASSSPDRVVDAIYQGILAGRYVPGQKLVEADLTSGLGISRGPVREAMTRLNAEGVVVLTRHRGAYIRAFTRPEVLDLLEVLEVLMVLSARLAAEAITKAGNAEMVRSAFERLSRFRQPGFESIDFVGQRTDFYSTLVAVGGNSQLPSMIPRMRMHLVRLQVEPHFSRSGRLEWLEEDAAVTAAILEGDAIAAQYAMRQHIKNMHQRIAKLPGEAFASKPR
jgi:DNA-binding GntR family transcriptional regulator